MLKPLGSCVVEGGGRMGCLFGPSCWSPYRSTKPLLLLNRYFCSLTTIVELSTPGIPPQCEGLQWLRHCYPTPVNEKLHHFRSEKRKPSSMHHVSMYRVSISCLPLSIPFGFISVQSPCQANPHDIVLLAAFLVVTSTALLHASLIKPAP
jgi:hypothetical protein